MLTKIEVDVVNNYLRLASRLWIIPLDWHDIACQVSPTKSKWRRAFAILTTILNLLYFGFAITRLPLTYRRYKISKQFEDPIFHCVRLLIHTGASVSQVTSIMYRNDIAWLQTQITKFNCEFGQEYFGSEYLKPYIREKCMRIFLKLVVVLSTGLGVSFAFTADNPAYMFSALPDSYKTGWTFLVLLLLETIFVTTQGGILFPTIALPLFTYMSSVDFWLSSQVLSDSDFNRLNIGQKRPNRPNKSKDSIAKKNKATGDPYKGRAGIFHPGILPPEQGKVCGRCNKSGCDISVPDRQNLFHQFRALDCNGQNSILASCIHLTEPKEKRVPQGRKYFVNSNGKSLEICKKSILYLFSISRQRLETVANKLKSGELSPRDKRGKHNNRPNRVPNSVKQDIRDHVNTFPTYESHYTRNQTVNSKLYSNPEISVTLMYDLFIQSQRNLNRGEAEEWMYRNIFATEFELKIGDPKLDTCDMCDKFNVQPIVHPDWNLHKNISKASYVSYKPDCDRSKIDASYVVLTSDNTIDSYAETQLLCFCI